MFSIFFLSHSVLVFTDLTGLFSFYPNILDMAGGVRMACFLVGILINLLPGGLIIVFLSPCGRVLVIFFQLLKTSVEKNELFSSLQGAQGMQGQQGETGVKGHKVS